MKRILPDDNGIVECAFIHSGWKWKREEKLGIPEWGSMPEKKRNNYQQARDRKTKLKQKKETRTGTALDREDRWAISITSRAAQVGMYDVTSKLYVRNWWEWWRHS